MSESLFNKVAGLKLPCEFCEISKSTLFHRTPLVAPSVTEWFCHVTCFAKVYLVLLGKLQHLYHKEVITHTK